MKKTVVGFKTLVDEKMAKLAMKIACGNATKTEIRRYENALRILSNLADPARYNKADEVLDVKRSSRKTEVSKPGKNDDYGYYEGKLVRLEKKTNVSRCGSLYRMEKPEKELMTYAIDLVRKGKGNDKNGNPRPDKHIVLSKKLFIVADLLALAEMMNAMSDLEHLKKNDKEPAIRGDKLAFAELLQDYPIEFRPDHNYTAAEIEQGREWVRKVLEG